MANLVIKENELKQLDELIGVVPTKYGVPLVMFFQGIGQRRLQEAQQEAQSKLLKKPQELGSESEHGIPDETDK